jgi:hypothetical protein
MNIPDHISESLETSFWVKRPKSFDADCGCGSESGISESLEPWIRDKHPGSATLVSSFFFLTYDLLCLVKRELKFILSG